MGHANFENLNNIFVKKIYAKGKVSVAECIEYCKRNNEVVHASEGEYNDEYMLSFAFDEIVLFHGLPWSENGHRPNIEPIIENEKQKAMMEHFKKEGFSGLEDYDNDAKEFNKIQWRFTKGARTLYLKKQLPVLSSFEN